MDFLPSQHHGKRAFITKTSADADSYGMLRRFMMDLGVEASAFSNGRLPPVPPVQLVRQKCKKISASHSEFTAAMLHLFKKDEAMNKEKRDFVDTVLTALASKDNETNQPANSTGQTRLTPIQMLETFKAHLMVDEPRINFNYIGFSRVCLQLLDKVMLAVKAHSPQRTMKHGHEVAIKSAADANAKGQPISETVKTVAQIIQPTIASTGKKYSNEALRLSSGHIPKDHSPRLSPSSMPPIEDIEIEETMKEYFPGGSVGSSRKTIEIYDPTGSIRKFKDLVYDRMLLSIMPYGVNKNMGAVVSADKLSKDDLEESRGPGTNVFVKGPFED